LLVCGFAAEVAEDLLQRADQILLVDLALPERQRQAVAPVRCLEAEHVRPPPAALGLVAAAPEALAQVVAVEAAPGDLLQQLDHLRFAPGLEDLEEQRLGRDGEGLDRVADARRDLQERQALRDHRPRPGHRRGDLLVRVAVRLGQQAVPLGLFERRQVLPLQVLDERDLERLLLGDVHLDDRNLVEPGFLRRPVAALAGDDPVQGSRVRLLVERPGSDEDRLEDAFLADREHQIVQVSHRRPRLARVRLDRRKRSHLPHRSFMPGGELLDEVRVVAHLDAQGKPSLARGVRHGSRPPPTAGSTHRPPSSAARR
jgi:hypothetical protein